ncbi:MAG: hypothetical protein MAGBODY4_00795 [Candidatus Marinimicrobia bacterium]|nr:hypothetical protein [Candidatus Neomarinimicrobiota bacterium]
MYFESTEGNTVITQKPVGGYEMTGILESLPILDFRIDENFNKQTSEDNTMKFNKEYSTYHSENNCQDWMLTD